MRIFHDNIATNAARFDSPLRPPPQGNFHNGANVRVFSRRKFENSDDPSPILIATSRLNVSRVEIAKILENRSEKKKKERKSSNSKWWRQKMRRCATIIYCQRTQENGGNQFRSEDKTILSPPPSLSPRNHVQKRAIQLLSKFLEIQETRFHRSAWNQWTRNTLSRYNALLLLLLLFVRFQQ